MALSRLWVQAGVCMILLISCGEKSVQLPSRLSRFPDDLNNSSLALSGVYRDGWTGKTITLNLRQPAGDQAFSFRGMIPKIGETDFHEDVEVRVDDKLVDRRSVGVGDFQIVAPVAGTSGARRVTVDFSATQQLPGGDNREVATRLSFIGFEPTKGQADIVRGAGTRLGGGWGGVETFQGETFRWVDNDAQVQVTSDKSGDAAMSLLVEPGPGVGGPFLLKAVDPSGRQIASARVNRRETVELFIPVEAAKTNEFRLHVNGGGKKTPNDPRVLNFRVFQIGAEPAPVSAR